MSNLVRERPVLHSFFEYTRNLFLVLISPRIAPPINTLKIKKEHCSYFFCVYEIMNTNIDNITPPACKTNKGQACNKSYFYNHSNHTDFEFGYSEHIITSLVLYYKDSQLYFSQISRLSY
jgi:hypothetical protein